MYTRNAYACDKEMERLLPQQTEDVRSLRM